MIEHAISAYGILALTHLFLQINLSHTYFVRNNKENINKDFKPRVAIVIPSFNEDYKDLRPCVLSCLEQGYPNAKVILVDDGSSNPDAFKRVAHDFYKHEQFQALMMPRNVGKRNVQKVAFDYIDHEHDIIVTIDSDTVLAKDAVTHIIQKFEDPTIGAITGNVRAIKTNKILTKLIDGRYWTAFNQERAAQSLFGTVLCCSGPLAAYRSTIVRDVKDRYISQFFLGTKCTFGDDRHLTNLVLEKGYQVKYEPNAHAITHVPFNLKTFLKQQIRWNKSFYRELLVTTKIVAKKPRLLHPYIIYDLLIQTILPLLMITSLSYALATSFLHTPYKLLSYVIILVGVALLRTMYGYLRTKDKSLLLFPMYSFLHIFLLVPMRIYSIFTINRNHWGTR